MKPISRIITALSSSLLLALIINISAFADNMTFSAKGTAYAASEPLETVLYVAQHQLDFTTRKGSVDYIDREGTLIANKQMDFSASLYCPTFSTELINHSQRYGIRQQNTELVMFRNDQDKVIPAQDSSMPLICDGGFDYFVKRQILDSNNTTTFHFAVPYSQASLDMQITLLENKKVKPGVTAVAEQSCNCSDISYYIIQPKSWLYRMFAPPVVIGYQNSSKRLVVFSGQSNILDESGKNPDVIIGYTY